MTTIYFTKKFTSGILTGLSAICSLTYPTATECADAIYVGKKGKDCLTGTRWIVTDASFQNYAR
jgi:hypothetical protein